MEIIVAYVTVEVDVELCDLDDQDLIDELEGRGWFVYEDEMDDNRLDDDETKVVLDMCANAKPGTIEYNIYEKLRKR
jgi:hypothetical protein